ncbi:MAG TPA: FlgD immunoglobulin-like domain containing protein [Candidatus Eisenbacteria bacterium]
MQDVYTIPTALGGSFAAGYAGDYYQIAAYNGRAFAAWADNRTSQYNAYWDEIVYADPDDPNAPSNIIATSDCTTPTSVTLDWDDPTTRVNGTPLGNFEIRITRLGGPTVDVDQGIETYTDAGLTTGTLYTYELRTHDEDNDSLSIVATITKYAGGDPTPAPPTLFTVGAIPGPAFDLDWTNPTVNIDGSQLCDFDGVNVYRNGAYLTTVSFAPGDIGLPGTYSDLAPVPGLNCYKLTAIDSEIPLHESAFTTEICVEVPLNPPFSDCFDVAGAPDPGKWTTDGAVVDGLGSNPPTPPNSLDLDGQDVVTSRAIDMGAASGSGYVLLYQKEQTGNGESPDPTNDLVIELYNSNGVWDEVNRHLGVDGDEVSFTTHVLALDSLVPSSGTYFHSQFRFRFRSTGDPGFDNWFVDCTTLDIPSCQATATVAPTSVDDTLVAGDPTGDADVVTVSNSCQFNALTWSAAESPDVSWLVLTGASGSISGLGSQNFVATFNATAMAPGVYNTDIVVTTNDPVNPTITVTATLTVTDAPDISVSPTSITNTLANTDPDAHDLVAINNVGTGPLEFFIRDASSAVRSWAGPQFVGVKRADGTVLPMAGAPAPTPSQVKAAWYAAELGDEGRRSARIDGGLDPAAELSGDRVRSRDRLKNLGDRGQNVHYPPQPFAQGGPDAAGYRWIDSDEANGPLFNWVDISGIGTDTGITGDDQNLGPFALGFAFNHYGTSFTGIRVCSNGFLSFTSSATPFTNTGVPNAAAPSDLVAPFWDDFNPANAGTIYYYQDVANNRFIVQYDAVSYYADDLSSNTFQVIINKDGTIVFQYLDIDSPSNAGTVGLQNAAGTVGLQVAFNQAYVHNELAVLLYQDATWLSATPGSGVVPPGDSAMLDVVSDPTGLAPGTYYGNILIQSNDPDEPVTDVHVELNVTGNGAALPFCDDFNSGAAPDAARWTNSGVVLNATGINEPSLPTSADLNGTDLMTSIQLDLSTAGGTGKTLIYFQEAGGGGDPPEAGNDLVVEFRNSSGVWDQVDRVFGGTGAATNYGVRIIDLDGLTPSSGTYFYPLFQLRIRTTGEAATDDWFVDDLCLSNPPCQPTISVNQTSVCDTLVAGSIGLPKSLGIANSCGYANLVFNIIESPDQPWLTVIPTNGVIAGATSTSVSLNFDATGMLPGTYNTTLFVTSNDPVTPSVPVAICLRVTGAPRAEVDPDSICPVVGIFGGPVIHRAASIQNTGVVPLTWRLSDTQGIPAAPNALDPTSTRRFGDPVPNQKKLELFKEVKDLVMPEYEAGTVGNDPEAKGYRNPFLGGFQPYGQGGPDAFGYRWIDSDQAGGPEFMWIELQGNGGIDTGLHADDVTTAPIAMGFNFPFYGTNFNSVRVCSNGWMSFTSTATAFTNTALPNTAQPNNTIAPLWDDYDMRNGVGTCYYRSDVALGRFIVEWKKVTRFNALSDTLTFQAILCKDGSITYNYLSVKGILNSNTIGIENAAGTTGLQVVFNANYVHNNLAVLIQNEQEWLSATPTSGTIPPGGTQLINVAFDPTGVAFGMHRGFLRITTNDPVLPKATIPVCFSVEDATAVELARFEALSTPDGVKLAWETTEEVEHSHFDVYRAEGLSSDFVQVNTSPITGRHAYEFTDAAVVDGAEYRYRLEAVDRFGGRVTYGPVVVTYAGRPAVFNLVQNYPNPFRGNTTFLLAMPVASDVHLRIFDAAGRLVRNVHDGAMDAGRHTFEWNGRDDAGSPAAAGFYFLRAESTQGTKVVRMMLVK